MFYLSFLYERSNLFDLFSLRRLPKNLSGKPLKQRSTGIKEKRSVARLYLILLLTSRNFGAKPPHRLL